MYHVCSGVLVGQKRALEGLERWFSGWERWLLFRRSWVQFPASTHGISYPSITLAPEDPILSDTHAGRASMPTR